MTTPPEKPLNAEEQKLKDVKERPFSYLGSRMAVTLCALLLFSAIGMWFWNGVVVGAFDVTKLNYSQSVILVCLVKLIKMIP